jgi:hypothetical protein
MQQLSIWHATCRLISSLLFACLQVLAQQGRARTATMKLPHYTAETPMFMPVGTQGGLLRRVLREDRQAATRLLCIHRTVKAAATTAAGIN